jgi:ribulose-5-phosphate 4-epimerase/fuculose-1-phosphate aldolase
MRFSGAIAVDARYNGLALDASEGERIARAMGSADVAFLGNHGVVVCGDRMDYAFDDLYYLERACMVEVLARSSGLPLVPVDEASPGGSASRRSASGCSPSSSSRPCGARCLSGRARADCGAAG